MNGTSGRASARPRALRGPRRLDDEAIRLHSQAHRYHEFAHTFHDYDYSGGWDGCAAIAEDNWRIASLDHIRTRLFFVARSSCMAYDFDVYDRELMVLTELVLLREHGIDADA